MICPRCKNTIESSPELETWYQAKLAKDSTIAVYICRKCPNWNKCQYFKQELVQAGYESKEDIWMLPLFLINLLLFLTKESNYNWILGLTLFSGFTQFLGYCHAKLLPNTKLPKNIPQQIIRTHLPRNLPQIGQSPPDIHRHKVARDVFLHTI